MLDEDIAAIKRAPRTYGRTRNTHTFTEELSISFEEADTSRSSISTGLDCPPNSDSFDALNTSNSSGHASDDDDDPAEFEYDWQKKLRQLNNQYSDEDDTALSVAKKQQRKDLQGQSTRPSSPADSQRDQRSVFGGSLSSLTSSSQPPATHLFREPFRTHSSLLSDEQEDIDHHRPSTPHSSPRLAFSTPHSGSSPTPPTSVETISSKAKGKACATKQVSRSSDDELMGSSKPSRRTSAGKGKKVTVRVKAPTKKERIETVKATARIISDQPTSIPRVQERLTLTALLGRVALPAAPRAKTPQLPTSDPIQSSSPIAESPAPCPKAASPNNQVSQGGVFLPNSLPGVAGFEFDDDDNFPDALKLFDQAGSLGKSLNLENGFSETGFSQFVTQAGAARDFQQLKRTDDDINLTPEPGVQVVVDVSNTFRKKADEIFEKEQVALAENMLAETSKSPEMFVDANGFLTQTRPVIGESPIRLATQFTPRSRFSVASSPGSAFMPSGLRQPLEPRVEEDPNESDLPTRRRLRKRDISVSPERILVASPKRNMFAVLGKHPAPKEKGKGKKPVRSEFIEGEAQESDDELTFGFGGAAKKPDDEEEEDGEDQDQFLSELVDDKEMDEDTLAEDAVREKDRELREIEDKNIEKLHMDAATGKLRIKRRDRGIGFEDSDSEEEGGRRPRPKKARKDNDNITALAKRPETQAFANAYRAIMFDDGNEFQHLNKDVMTLDLEQEETQQAEEAPEFVDAAQIRDELKKLSRQRNMGDAREFDPQDVSWLETAVGSDDEDQKPRVREVSNETVPTRRPNAHSMNSNVDEANRVRMAKWVKSETSFHIGAVVGRNSVGSAAVTGHGKSKASNGSFKPPRNSASPSIVTRPAKISRGPSILSTVSRRGKFAN